MRQFLEDLRASPRERPRIHAGRLARSVAGFSHYGSAMLAVLLTTMTLGTCRLSAQGLGYTLTPAATTVRWTDGLGLRNSTLLGGQVAFDFERFVSLQGYYFTNDGLRTAVDKLGLTSDLATRLANQKLDVRSYGANLVFSLGTGMIVPFVKGGGGVLEFRPQSPAAGTVTAGPTRQVALTLGGGLQLGILGPVRLDVFAEDLIFRVNRYALAAQLTGTPAGTGQLPPDAEQTKLRHNLVLGAGIAVPLGSSRQERSGPTQLYQWGIGGASFALEPMVGRLFFDNTQGIEDQDIAGMRAGFDMGRLLGLRGFYWRGTSSNFTNTDPIESWGAEAQLRLNSGPGLTPFLLLGGARLDFKDAFRTSSGSPAEDRTSLIAGGGVSFPIAERVAINLAARDYLYSQTSLDSVASVSDLRSDLGHNWLISAGLRLTLGGRSGRNLAVRREAEVRERGMRDQRDITSRADSLAPAGGAGGRSARDTVVLVLSPSERAGADTLRVVAGDTVRMRESSIVRSTAFERGRDTAVARGYASDRIVTIPVPIEGELYVRYGPPGAAARRIPPSAVPGVVASSQISEGELRDAVRVILREEVAAEWARLDEGRAEPRARPSADTRSLNEEQLTAIERRLSRRMDDILDGPVASRSEVRIPIRKRDTMPRAPQPSAQAVSEGDADARMDARLAERIEYLVAQRVRDELARRPKDTVVVRARATLPAEHIDTLRMITRESSGEVALSRPRFATFTRFMPYSGATLSAGHQGLFGFRVDIGPVSRNLDWLRLVPELALGFGSGGQSAMVAGNVQVELPSLRFGEFPAVTPHVGAGLGILRFSDPVGSRDGTEGVLNLGYGTAIDLWSGGRLRPSLLIEHQGIDLFALNRLLVGLSWRF